MNLLSLLFTTIPVKIVVTLILYYLDRILPTKKSDLDFHQARIVWPYNLLSFLLTYRQTLRRIFHIEYFYVHISHLTCIYLHSPTHSWDLWYFLIPNNGIFYHLCVYSSCHALHIPIQLYSFPPSKKLLKNPPCFGFVMKYPHTISFGKYLICTLSFSTLSDIKR